MHENIDGLIEAWLSRIRAIEKALWADEPNEPNAPSPLMGEGWGEGE
ncbi:MAG: hypothetical protein Q8N74_06180 [Sulfuricella sp.]|nr:hypothetical protein [Sulfuricella sp.]